MAGRPTADGGRAVARLERAWPKALTAQAQGERSAVSSRFMSSTTRLFPVGSVPDAPVAGRELDRAARVRLGAKDVAHLVGTGEGPRRVERDPRAPLVGTVLLEDHQGSFGTLDRVASTPRNLSMLSSS